MTAREPYYADDMVTLYHGDCLDVDAWLAADVLVTDPPYGRAWKQGNTKLAGLKRNDRSSIANDHDVSTRDSALAAWGGRVAIVFGNLMLAPPRGVKLVAVYHKDDRVAGFMGAVGSVRRDAEALYFIGPWATGMGGRSSIFTTKRLLSGAAGIAAKTGHPHTKPLNVMSDLILQTQAGTIADPFAGSGSTLVAAKLLGRKAIGVELDERYCEVAAKRLAQGVFDFGAAP